MMTEKRMGPKDWTMLITLSIIWGGSFFFSEIAVRELPTFTIVASRVTLAAAALWIVLLTLGHSFPRDHRILSAFLGMGLLNNALPFSLLVYGQSQIASGLASIFNATTPLFTVVIAHILTTDEGLTRHRLLGVLAGLAGVVTMVGGDAFTALTGGVIGHIACLGAAVSYGFAMVFGRRFRDMGVSPIATATGQVTASSLLLLPAVFLFDQPWTLPVPSTITIASLVALAVLCTAFAYLLFFRILASAGATNVALVTFLVPVSAILLGVLVLGEKLAPQHLAGMIFIALGLLLIDGRLSFKK